MISTSEVVDEIERQIIGQRQGKVWCAPNAVVLPGDAGTLQYDAIWKVAQRLTVKPVKTNRLSLEAGSEGG